MKSSRPSVSWRYTLYALYTLYTLYALLTGMLCLLLTPARAAHASPPLLELSAGIHRIEAEIADTPDIRERGLMHRRTLASQRGMLFVFPEEATHCMWMKNTLIPLSVAFLDNTGKVINIEEMQPQTLNNHCADQPAKFALEMNYGWFQKRKINSGTRIIGIDKIKAFDH